MDDQHPQSLGKAFLTGLVLLLPLFIIAIAIYWLFKIVTGLTSPMTGIITNMTGIPDLAGHALVLFSVLGLILLIGILSVPPSEAGSTPESKCTSSGWPRIPDAAGDGPAPVR